MAALLLVLSSIVAPVMQGLDGVLKRRGHPSVKNLKAKTAKKPCEYRAKLSKKFHLSECNDFSRAQELRESGVNSGVNVARDSRSPFGIRPNAHS
jgi:hypothetical protein